MLTIVPKPEPTIPVDRQWIADMLSSLEAGDVEDCRLILLAALRLFDERELLKERKV